MKRLTTYIIDGEKLKVVDIGRGIEMAERVFAQRGLCYRNSFLTLREMANPLTEYVEGYAIFYSDTFFNFWHRGWLELDGEIIDPYPGMDWTRYGVIYFPCKKYSFKDAMEYGRNGLPQGNQRLRFIVPSKTYCQPSGSITATRIRQRKICYGNCRGYGCRHE